MICALAVHRPSTIDEGAVLLDEHRHEEVRVAAGSTTRSTIA
jgi:hypothetical protein